MACDGLWKVFSNDEAAAFVTTVLEVGFIYTSTSVLAHDVVCSLPPQDPTIQLPDGMYMYNVYSNLGVWGLLCIVLPGDFEFYPLSCSGSSVGRALFLESSVGLSPTCIDQPFLVSAWVLLAFFRITFASTLV